MFSIKSKNLSLKIGHNLLLLFGRSFSVDIHRRRNVCMTHNLLDHLQIRFILTESCAECMTKLVRSELRNEIRFSLLCLCLFFFLLPSFLPHFL